MFVRELRNINSLHVKLRVEKKITKPSWEEAKERQEFNWNGEGLGSVFLM